MTYKPDLTRAELESKLAEHGVTLVDCRTSGYGDEVCRILLHGFPFNSLAHFYLLKDMKCAELYELAYRYYEGELSRRQKIVEQAAAAEMRKALMCFARHANCLKSWSSQFHTSPAWPDGKPVLWGTWPHNETEDNVSKIYADNFFSAEQALAAATYSPPLWEKLRKEGKI